MHKATTYLVIAVLLIAVAVLITIGTMTLFVIS